MLALAPLRSANALLVLPPFGVATTDAYRWVDEHAPTAKPTVLSRDALATWSDVAAISANDFEAPVIARHPQIGEAIDALRAAGATIARMSGSGSTVFGIWPSSEPPSVAISGARVVPARVTGRVVPVVVTG
jgi:4-diphosphocytidyl-2-C-methyl-D-erythritol kinase